MARRDLRILRAGFGVALLAVLVAVVGPARLVATLAAADPAAVAAAAAVYLAMVGVKCRRWLAILRIQGLALGARAALRAYGLGMLLGAVTPGRLGQHVKALALVRRGATLERALAGTIVDQLLDMLLVACVLPVAVVYFGASLSGSAAWGAASLLLAVLLGAVAVRLERRRLAPAAAEAWRLGRRALGGPLLLSAASTLLYFATLGLLGRAVGMTIGTVTLALASVASAVVEMAPVTVAGLGTREAALLGLLHPLGVEPPAVLALTLLVRGIQVAAGGIAYAAGRGD